LIQGTWEKLSGEAALTPMLSEHSFWPSVGNTVFAIPWKFQKTDPVIDRLAIQSLTAVLCTKESGTTIR
jgi:hypothetical protein